MKVIGDMEGVDNTARMVPCQGRSSVNQREDKGGASAAHQLRKRKKLFWREFQPDVFDYVFHKVHTSSHACDPLVQTFPTCCLLNCTSYSFIRCFVPSGSHRIEPLGGSGCGSSFALQDLNQ